MGDIKGVVGRSAPRLGKANISWSLLMVSEARVVFHGRRRTRRVSAVERPEARSGGIGRWHRRAVHVTTHGVTVIDVMTEQKVTRGEGTSLQWNQGTIAGMRRNGAGGRL